MSERQRVVPVRKFDGQPDLWVNTPQPTAVVLDQTDAPFKPGDRVRVVGGGQPGVEVAYCVEPNPHFWIVCYAAGGWGYAHELEAVRYVRDGIDPKPVKKVERWECGRGHVGDSPHECGHPDRFQPMYECGLEVRPVTVIDGHGLDLPRFEAGANVRHRVLGWESQVVRRIHPSPLGEGWGYAVANRDGWFAERVLEAGGDDGDD